MITGQDFKDMRFSMMKMLRRRITRSQLGGVLLLAPENAKRTVERWEEEYPTGPAAIAMILMHAIAGCDDPNLVQKLNDMFDQIGDREDGE